jgi:glycosidase
MRKTVLLAASLLVLAACGCGKPQTLPIIPSGTESGTGGKETIPEPGITYATEVLTLPATARDHYQIYQVNLKLYGSSGAFGKVQARLDDIKALGTDILYLMPVYPEGKEKAIGSPYCIKDFKGVNPNYGTLDELKALVTAAKAKGMKVMFDWVANHTAWDNPWITEHPEWYEHKSDGSIAWPTKDGAWTDVAQLDYARKELWAAMEDALEYWVKEVGIDGYRCDYAHGVRDDFWKEAIGRLKALKPGFIMLAESDYERMFDDGFDIIFDRAMKSQMRKVIGSTATSKTFFDWYKGDQGKAPAPKTKLFFVTNHDDATEAAPAAQFKSKDGALAAYMLMAALNGSSMLYGSQEIGYDKTINFFNTQTMNWAADEALTKKYQDALQALSKVDRSGAMVASESEGVVYVAYPKTLVGVNVSGKSCKASLPKANAGKDGVPTSQDFGAYEFKIWHF